MFFLLTGSFSVFAIVVSQVMKPPGRLMSQKGQLMSQNLKSEH